MSEIRANTITDAAGTGAPDFPNGLTSAAGGSLNSPALTGTPTAPTATVGTNTTQIATTAFVIANAGSLDSPAFTGTPTAPTASVGTNTTQLATTAFVNAEIANDAPTKTGGGASGTWNIAISGNAATATSATDSTKLPLTGGTVNGPSYFTSSQNTGASAGNASLQAYSTGGNGAVMSFHRSGVYAVNMGLDSDNVFRIGGWSAGANLLQMDMSGNLTMANNVTAYSDIRLKEDLEPITDAIEKVQSLTGYTYTRIDSGQRQTGLIAQEVQKVLPEAVMDNGEHLSLAYGNLVGLLIEAIKEQQVQINELKSRLKD